MKNLYLAPFTHNMMGDLYKGFLDFFSDNFPRIHWKVIGTYFKAVEYINKKKQFGREVDMPMLPMLALNPSGDFIIEEKYGRMLWRFPLLLSSFGSELYEPIYQDQHVKITPIFTRLRGDLELNLICPSYYEYLDSKLYLNLLFGSTERYIYPKWFNIFTILPANFRELIYENDVSGQEYEIDIPDIESKMIKTIARDRYVYPAKINPIFRLTGMNDASNRYGGTDDIPKWNLGFTVEYEVELPTQFVIETDYLLEQINFDVMMGLVYSKNSMYNSGIPPEEIRSFSANYDWHLADSTDSTSSDIPDVTILPKKDRIFKIRYYHIVTEEESSSSVDIEISLPEKIDDPDLLMVISPQGRLQYWVQYDIIDDGDTLILHVDKLTLSAGEFLELYVYEYGD